MRVSTSKVSPVFSRVCTLLEGNLTVYMRTRRKERNTSKKMKVNIIADFKENGVDKNEPHIVVGAVSEMAAGHAVKEKIEAQGGSVQMLTVVEGEWTLEELHDMANYGIGKENAVSRILYLSLEARDYFEKIKNDPEEAKRLREELAKRMRTRK